jgi:hypothetical protein
VARELNVPLRVRLTPGLVPGFSFQSPLRQNLLAEFCEIFVGGRLQRRENLSPRVGISFQRNAARQRAIERATVRGTLRFGATDVESQADKLVKAE